MIFGTIDHHKKAVSVVGGGISGMLAAYRLEKLGFQVSLFEKTDRLGGLIQTLQSPYGIVETAAHGMMAPTIVENFLNELEVPLVRVHNNARSKFIYRNGKMRRLPLGLLELAGVLFRAYYHLADKKIDPSDLTLEQWGKRHLGQAALNYFISPMVRGIFGARPSEVGIRVAFPQWEVTRGNSLISDHIGRLIRPSRKRQNLQRRSSHKFVSPIDGMGSFVLKLGQALEKMLGDRLKLGTEIVELRQDCNTMLCVPSYTAAQILKHSHPEVGAALGSIRYVPLISVTAFVSTDSIPSNLSRGIGVLIPEVESQRKCLGILFNSFSFPHRVHEKDKVHSFTVLLGGTSAPHWLDASEREIVKVVREELKEILRIKGEPFHIVITKIPMAVPLYEPSILKVWQKAKESWCARPGQLLFSNYTGQVSVRGLIEAIIRWNP